MKDRNVSIGKRTQFRQTAMSGRMFPKQLGPASWFKLLIKLVGYICYLVHMYFIFYNQVFPSETFTRLEERHLDDIDFPVIFKLCVTPALNVTELKSAGYNNIWRFFLGQSSHNTSLYGWGGHSSLGTPRQSVRGQRNCDNSFGFEVKTNGCLKEKSLQIRAT